MKNSSAHILRNVMVKQQEAMSIKMRLYNGLWKVGHLPFIRPVAFFFVEILGGYKVYRMVRKKFGEESTLLICPHPGTGDIYNIGLYFSHFLKKNAIRRYVFLFRGKSEQKVGNLFGIKEGIILSERETIRLTRFARFVGAEKIRLIQLHHYPFPVYANASLANFEGYKGITFTRMFKEVAMGLENDALPVQPQFWEIDVQDYFEKNGLKPGKTVILAPYSTSAQAIALSIWERLAEMLKDVGYTVATNCASEHEVPIAGTLEIRFEYEYAKSYMECAGYLVAARSGLCDVVSTVNCRKIVLTPSWSPLLPWLGGPGKTLRFYGMWPNYKREDTVEIEYTCDNTALIPDKVLEVIEQDVNQVHEIRLS